MGDKDVDLDLSGSIGVGLTVVGNAAQPVTVDLGLDDINIDLGAIHIDPLTIDLGLDDVNIAIDPLKVDLGLDNVNVCLSLGITEFPRMQIHVPTKYDFGFCLFGLRVFNFTFAGETMLVTQDNPPRMLYKAKPRVRSPVPGTPGTTVGTVDTKDQVAVTVLGEEDSS